MSKHPVELTPTSRGYAIGGVVGGGAVVTVADDECIVRPGLTCGRKDDRHRAARVLSKQDRPWACPLHDGEASA